MALGLALAVPRFRPRPRVHLVAPTGRVFHAVEFEPVRSHPGQKGLNLPPAGSHDAEALDYGFENGDLAHVIRRVVGLRAFLNESELDDRCYHDSIQGKVMSFEFEFMRK